MTRIPLETVVMRTKELGMGKPLELLALALDPPAKSLVIDAVLRLKELGGLFRFDQDGKFSYEDGDVTFLGSIMSALPLDVTLTRFIVIGYMFSVLKEAIIIAAGLTIKSIFATSYGHRMKSYITKTAFANGSQSDCIAILNAYNQWMDQRADESFKGNAERGWCERNNLDVKNIHEMRLLVDEITSRLYRLRVKELPGDEQPKWNPRDLQLILKVCIAGGFGAANFFVPPESNTDAERDAARVINEMDIFTTVFYKNMNPKLIGPVYEQQLRQILLDKKVISETTNMKCVFTPLSEKVFLSFEADPSREDHFPIGRIPAEVYKAIKLRYLDREIFLKVMSEEETFRYAADVGLGSLSDTGEFKMKVNTIKRPDLCVLPTTATKKMLGKVTHIVSPNKFFFRPTQAALNEKFEVFYKPNHKKLMQMISTAKMVCIANVTNVREGLYVIIDYNKCRERGNFLRQNGSMFEVYLIDKGCIVDDVEPTKTFAFVDADEEQSIIDIPPLIFECSLKEIRPSSVSSIHGLWSPKAVDLFRTSVLNNEVLLDIYSVVNDVASVDLIRNDVNWNLKLLKDGDAEECEESYASKANHENRVSRFRAAKPLTAAEEFQGKIDTMTKQQIVPSPDPKTCKHTVKLVGPFSPIEAELHGCSRIPQAKVVVDSTSINSVLFNDEILSLHSKFCVAANVTVSQSKRGFTIRETTAMPNIPGLAVILAMIFAPTVEMHRDNAMSRFVSILTGLGCDKERKQPFYGERDAVFDLKVELSSKDLTNINNLRFSMSRLTSLAPGENFVDLPDGEKKLALEKIQQFIRELLSVQNRPVVETNRAENAFDWNTDAQPMKASSMYQKIFQPITIPPLLKAPRDDLKELNRHVQELKMCACGSITLYKKICKLCNYYWEQTNDLQIHLLSTKHRSICAQLEAKLN